MCGLFGGFLVDNLTEEGKGFSPVELKHYVLLLASSRVLRDRGPDKLGLHLVSPTNGVGETVKIPVGEKRKDIETLKSKINHIDPTVILGSYRGIPATEDKNPFADSHSYNSQPYVIPSPSLHYTRAQLKALEIEEDMQHTLFITHNGQLNSERESLNNVITAVVNTAKSPGFEPRSIISIRSGETSSSIEDIDTYYLGRALQLRTIKRPYSAVHTIMNKFKGSFAIAAYESMDNEARTGNTLTFASTFRVLHFLRVENLVLYCSDLDVLREISLTPDVNNKKFKPPLEFAPITKNSTIEIVSMPAYSAIEIKLDANSKLAPVSQVSALRWFKKQRTDGLPSNAIISTDTCTNLELLVDEYFKSEGGHDGKAGSRILKVACVLSGGLDSTVATYSAAQNLQKEVDFFNSMTKVGISHFNSDNAEIHLLHFKYGAIAEEREIEACKHIQLDLQDKHPNIKVILKFIDGNFLKSLGGSILTTNGEVSTGETGVETVSEWVPARNLWMIGTVASYCDRWGIGSICLGLNEQEGSVYSDNSPEFIEAMSAALDFGTQVRPKLFMPVRTLMKHGILNKAKDLDVPLGKTWSCYKAGELPCGECGPCTMRLRAHSHTVTPETQRYQTYPEWFPVNLTLDVKEKVATSTNISYMKTKDKK